MPPTNPLDNIYVKIPIVATVYVIVLIFISPIIDHLFTNMEEDLHKNESDIEILSEIISQIIVISIAWYFLHGFLRVNLEKLLNIKIKEGTKTAIDFVSAVVLVGLQKNLIDKLSYITSSHPIRL
jgi:hypothetical protein|tara:strand:- start:1153 stop:1527 length:375 start_codon:yes stop_codon:yes gene_type:complete